MNSLCSSGGSGDGGVGSSGSGGGRSSSRSGAVRWEVSGGGQLHLQRRQHETLPHQQLRELYARRSGGGGSSGSRCAAVQLEFLAVTWRNCSGVCARPLRLRKFVSGTLSVGRLGVVLAARTSFAQLPRWLEQLRLGGDTFALDFDAILTVMYDLTIGAEGDCSLCVLRDPRIEATTLGASESALTGNAPAEALHTFTLDSVASIFFFRDRTTLTPLSAPVPVRLADPLGGPVLARSSTVLPCLAVPSGSLSGLHLPSFSTNLVSTAALQDAMVTTTTPRASSGSCVCPGVCVRCGSTRLLVSPPVAPESPVAPPPWSPVPATPSWHALPLPCLWSSQVSASPPALACPPCLPCVEGRQRAAPHSSFPPTTAPLQTLHMDEWGPARVSEQGRERYFLLVVDDYMGYTTVFTLRSKGEVPDVLIPWIHAFRLQLRERFCQDLPVMRLHSYRGGEFSSDLLRDFCRGEGILQSFTVSTSPQQDGIAKRRIGLVMEVAHTSMINASAPHFMWPFAVRYAAHQLNIWPRVSLPETPPTLRWTGKVGDASVFQVRGSRAFVCDTPVDKLSARAIPCVFLGFSPNAPSCQFYHPTSRCVFSSQDVTFDEPVLFYHPLIGTMPVEIAVASGAARGAVPGGAESEGVGSGDAEPGGAEPGGAERVGVEPGGVEPGGAECEGAESGGAEPRGTASSGGPTGASPRLSPRPEPLSPQQLREWFAQRTRLRSGAVGAGDSSAEDTGAGGAGVTVGAGGTRGAGAGGAGAGDTRAVGAGAGGTGAGGVGAGGAGVGDTRAVDPGAGGAGAGGDVSGGTAARGTVRPRQFFVPLLHQILISPTRAIRIGRGVPRPRPPSVPGTHALALCPSSVPLRFPPPPPPESSLPAVPDPESDLACAASPTVSRLLATVDTDPAFESIAASALVAELVDFAAVCHLYYATTLLAESESASPPSVDGECALGTHVLEDRQEDFECLAAAVPRFASMLLASEGDPDAPDIPTPRSYAEAITVPYSSQWKVAMDAEMASWKSTGTYVDEVPPSGANIVDGMWIFGVKRPPGSPPVFKAHYVARGFRQREGVDYFQTFSPTPKMTTLRVLLHVAAPHDYELHSLDLSTAFLQGSLHEEIWLRRPPGFTTSFPAGTQWSLRRPLYGLRQVPREWHDMLRTTVAALGFTPSTADPSLFLSTDTSLPPFYVLVYVDDLVFATADNEALTLAKSELQKRHTCTDLGEQPSYLGLQITRDRAPHTIRLTQSHMVHQVLQRFGFQFSSPQPNPQSTGHSLSAPPLDESVEPSGLYPELVGCLMYLMMCTRPNLAYNLSLLARYVAPVRRAWG
ncbi:unnamed protein product [Closterium sp. NIES-53]